MSLFTRLNTIFRADQQNKSSSVSQPSKKPVNQPDPQLVQQAKEIIDSAQKRAQDIMAQAKKDADRLKSTSASELKSYQTQLEEGKQEFAKHEKNLKLQEVLLNKKQNLVNSLQKNITDFNQQRQQLIQKLIDALSDTSGIEAEQAREDLLSKFQHQIESEAAKELDLHADAVRESADEEIKTILAQVAKHGSINYQSDYTPPLVVFENSQEERLFTEKYADLLQWIEQETTVEITHDPEAHHLKLYCFNTIKREQARVLLERMRKQRHLNLQSVKKLYSQVVADLDQQMYEAGKQLCNALRVFNLPKDMVHRLGMFKYRYSYGQNMILHTWEEARIGIALAHELGANSNVVRLGCLFHDIGKVIYDDDNTNHVETGVKYLREHNMPESVIACVAESHEDIPFSSIESMIVHVADAISGARPGARFDDVEGFMKHQQGMIEISMSHQGVMDAYVTNGGREVRVFVDPDEVKDDQLDKLATSIRDQVQEFSTYPGSIVVNVFREYQHSEVKE